MSCSDANGAQNLLMLLNERVLKFLTEWFHFSILRVNET